MAFGAGAPVEDRTQPIFRLLYLQEIIQAQPEQLEFKRSQAAHRVAELRLAYPYGGACASRRATEPIHPRSCQQAV